MKPQSRLPKPLQVIAEFMRLEASAGILLFATAMLALIWSNSPWESFYHLIIHEPFIFSFHQWHIKTPAIFWINDVLMAIFFLLVGLEIKREICVGELNSPRKIMLPAIAALGGMIVPAVVYLIFNAGDHLTIHGWAIPTATDIAFALGIISLLGNRVPHALKLYLMALAIFDDLGAIIIIALFYQAGLFWPALIGILGCMGVLFALNRMRVHALWVYCLVGIVMWGFFLKSGIHPTLAGVILALMIPLNTNEKNNGASPLRRLESGLHPWVAYAILPLFSFANAGVSFSGLNIGELFSAVPLGIMLGLFIGKQVGVFVATWLAIRCGVAFMPQGGSWSSLYAMGMVCGVGFTMSLFIGNLAFTPEQGDYAALVRFGVLAGSLLSGVVGYVLLRRFCKKL